MTFRWRAFERQARARTRRAVKASPVLKRLRRHAKPSRLSSSQLPAWFARLVFLGFAGTVIVSRKPDSEFLLAVMALWTVGMVFHRGIDLYNLLHAASALYVMSFLPVSDDRMFQAQWRVFLRKSLWTALDFGVIGALVVLTSGQFGWGRLAAALMAAWLPWLFVTASGTVCCAFAPLRHFRWPASLLLLAALALLFFGHGLVDVTRTLALVGAWVPGLLPLVKVLQPAMPVAAAPLVGGTLAGITVVTVWPLAWRCLRANYRLGEDTLAFLGMLEAARSGHATAPAEWAEPFRRGADEARSAIQTGEFLAGLDWSAGGVLERVFSRLLTPRERVVAEFITAGDPGWTAGVRRAVITLGVATVVLWFVPKALAGLSILLVFLAVFFFLNLLGGWRGMGAAPGAGLQCPCFATLPIRLRDIIVVNLKINFLRLLCITPVVGGGWFLVASHWKLPAGASLLAAKVILAGFLLLPVLPVLSISPFTNDTRRLGFTVAALLIGLLALAAGIVFFVAESLMGMVTAGLAAGVLCVCFLLFYAWYFNHCRFDLVPLVKPDQR